MKTKLDELIQEGWIFVGNYADLQILAKGDERALYVEESDRVIIKYNIKEKAER